MPIERKLAAIMFTDIASYSLIMASVEEPTLEVFKDLRIIMLLFMEKNTWSMTTNHQR